MAEAREEQRQEIENERKFAAGEKSCGGKKKRKTEKRDEISGRDDPLSRRSRKKRVRLQTDAVNAQF